MIIGSMRKEDTLAAAYLERKNFSLPWSQNAFLKELDNEYAIYLVAKEEEKLLGVCGLLISFDEGEILNVSVDESARRKGIAQQMLIELMKQGRERGVKDFTLEVRQSNVAAIHLYEKLGFVSQGVRPRFYSYPTEDAVIYWLRSN